jgi:hypothetical protein
MCCIQLAGCCLLSPPAGWPHQYLSTYRSWIYHPCHQCDSVESLRSGRDSGWQWWEVQGCVHQHRAPNLPQVMHSCLGIALGTPMDIYLILKNRLRWNWTEIHSNTLPTVLTIVLARVLSFFCIFGIPKKHRPNLKFWRAVRNALKVGLICWKMSGSAKLTKERSNRFRCIKT